MSAIPIPGDDAEKVLAAFCDGIVTSCGSFDTLSTDNGPQLTSQFFSGGCRMMGIQIPPSETFTPQTQEEVWRYNRPFVAQLQSYMAGHQGT